MENACKSKYECEQYHEQGKVILPLLDVWRLESIESRSGRFQQSFGILFRPCNTLKLWNQFWSFCVKNANSFSGLRRNLLVLVIRFSSPYVCERFRLTKQAQNPFNQCFWICDFHESFFNLFVMKNMPIMEDLPFLDMKRIATLH